VNAPPLLWRAEASPPTPDALRAEPRAQLPQAAAAPCAEPRPQRPAGDPHGQRRAGLRARWQPTANRPDARHPSPPDTPHRRRSHRRGATRLPCPPPSLRHRCTRLLPPHPNHLPTLVHWSPTTTPGPPITSRRTQLRQQHHPMLPEPTAQIGLQPYPSPRHQAVPPLRSDARRIRGRHAPTPPIPNPAYTDGSRRVNRGRQRRHELRLSTLTKNQPNLITDRRSTLTSRRSRPGPGLISRTWALLPERKRFYVFVTGPSPHLRTKRKPQVPRTCDVIRRHPISGFSPPRIFPHDLSQAKREFVRARMRPGLPRDQFSGPWLFSTAEARTSNSSSS
jgi:hypothetical protein